MTALRPSATARGVRARHECAAETACRRDHQPERAVGGGVGEHAGGVVDRDAAGGGGGHVDVVETHREIADHLEPGGAVQQGGVDAVGQERNQAGAMGRLSVEALTFGDIHVGERTVRIDAGSERRFSVTRRSSAASQCS